MSNDYSVQVHDLVKQYQRLKAVDGLTFQVNSGEIFGLLGPNGAGKSTTIEMLIGLRKRDGGDVNVLGIDPGKQPRKVKARVGVQLQSSSLTSYLTVKEIITLYASFYGNPLPVKEIIDQVGLTSKINSRTGNLSGGQQQRVAVAIALVSNGDIIFLDEPTTGLDPQSRHELWDIIRALKNQYKTVFLTTHFMDEAESLCDRVGIIDKGQIIALDTPQNLIDGYFKEKAIEIQGDELIKESFNCLEGLAKVEEHMSNYILYSNQVTHVLDQLFSNPEINCKVSNINIRQATLEDVFLKLTGRYISNESIS